jgi:hypothetical protein
MGLSRYMHFGEEWTDAVWRTRHPLQLYWAVSARLNPSLEIPLEIPQLK